MTRLFHDNLLSPEAIPFLTPSSRPIEQDGILPLKKRGKNFLPLTRGDVPMPFNGIGTEGPLQRHNQLFLTISKGVAFLSSKKLSYLCLSIMLLCLTASYCSVAQTQPSKIYTLEDAVKTAMQKNPDLVSAKLEVERADARVNEA
ncbi:MAG: hypothetical protein HY276_01785, partial [Ignavibacteriales bacterium]|nr:hypothetical protein [Ignavibacteriales bacterium]